jgi:hypothetical protein
MQLLSRVWLLTLGLAALVPVQASAADAPGGWSKARFGMTVEEVIAAFGGEEVRLDKPDTYSDGFIAPVAIPDTKIGPIEHARVNFLFPKDGDKPRLQRVVISHSIIEPKPGDDVRLRSEYDQLVKSLTEKYGSPSTQSQDGSARSDTFKQDASWFEPNVAVELSYFRSSIFGKEIACILSLTYRPPMSPADKDRL